MSACYVERNASRLGGPWVGHAWSMYVVTACDSAHDGTVPGAPGDATQRRADAGPTHNERRGSWTPISSGRRFLATSPRPAVAIDTRCISNGRWSPGSLVIVAHVGRASLDRSEVRPHRRAHRAGAWPRSSRHRRDVLTRHPGESMGHMPYLRCGCNSRWKTTRGDPKWTIRVSRCLLVSRAVR
jgi:hypothetical protein